MQRDPTISDTRIANRVTTGDSEEAVDVLPKQYASGSAVSFTTVKVMPSISVICFQQGRMSTRQAWKKRKRREKARREKEEEEKKKPTRWLEIWLSHADAINKQKRVPIESHRGNDELVPTVEAIP